MKGLGLKKSLSIALACVFTMPAVAQETADLENGRFAFGGYGDVTYIQPEAKDGEFLTKFVPIFLIKVSDKLHVEAELEFSIDADGATETEIEYTDIHYFITDNVTLTAGKFLLPFGQFGANLHPSWINKLPSAPGVYGGHGGNGLFSGVLPILSDVGFGIQYIGKIGRHSKWFVDLYWVNGVSEEEESHGSDGGNEHDEPVDEHEDASAFFPEIGFESTAGDNNNNKAMGGRIAVAFLPEFEAGYSFYNAEYDAAGELGFSSQAIDINWIDEFYSIRAEYIQSEADAYREEVHDDGDIHEELQTFRRSGWYLQGVWTLRQLGIDALNTTELVLRRSQLNTVGAGERWTYGINYWLSPSTVIKIAYEDSKMADGDDQTRLFVQFAFGF